MIKCVVFGCWNSAPNKSGLCRDHSIQRLAWRCDSDGRPKGGDAAGGSVHDSADPKGIARNE